MLLGWRGIQFDNSLEIIKATEILGRFMLCFYSSDLRLGAMAKQRTQTAVIAAVGIDALQP